MEIVDTVVVGAGIIGLCTALELSKRGAGKIIVVDKGAGPGEGSTGSSSAVCRAKYSIASTVALARDGIAAYANWGAFTGLADPSAYLHRDGVVWLSDGDRGMTVREAQRLAGLGVAAEVLDDAELAIRYPALNPCIIAPDLILGEPHACIAGGLHLVEPEGGYVDPVDAMQDLIRALRGRGVKVCFGSPIAAIATTGGRVAQIELMNGETIACATVVNAAGPWCRQLYIMAGLDNPWPLVPTRIQIVHIDRPPEVKGLVPPCADPSGGIYFRSQNRGQQILVGSVLEEDEREAVVDPDDFDRGVDELFVAQKLHALQHRIRGLDSVRTSRGYSGLYTINQSDVHPVIGATPVVGFYVANGFSGHGFKIAPAVGAMLAATITGTHSPTDTVVEPGFLAFDRTPIQIASRSVLA